ncbi:50S ribosomal protein L5 [Candidatus Poribacteria bacterium]|nr:50S ribosomal protein L5 [Candidatus Poribacteria bacterium]MYA69170.1 50S ribosomal protein L5 [Candidatus Poribacteria bacterium]MYH79771.1 50S ribosomal protein L5 [Candidatus Poribacteria bacterium]MYK96565.1 50S ribosomal protein L5 [Candidatus Poribacteria bacterium]
MSPFKEFYQTEVMPALQTHFNYGNVMQIPKLDKITLNIGVGEALQNPKALEDAVGELTLIAGQRAIITHAKKSVSAFKVREGMAIGCKVTLRQQRMYEFFNRLVNVVLPQIRDFRGVSPDAFDGRGNYSLGLTEQLIFPEIDYDNVNDIRGLNVTVVTTAPTDEEGRELLRLLGMPFQK